MNIHTIGSDLADLATKVEACRDESKSIHDGALGAVNMAKDTAISLAKALEQLATFIVANSTAHDAKLAALIADSQPVVQTEIN